MSPSNLIDRFGRRIDYLRISLTDRCNFRCIYCMPPQGLPLLPTKEFFTRDEIIRFVNIITPLGIRRIRLTGGEPLLRDDVVDIVREIKQETNIGDLSITTNGSQLAQFLLPLKEAGLDRINISLDSLGREAFQTITRTNAYQKVLEAIFLALEIRLPLKLNVVVLKNLNNHEIIDFVNLAYEYPIEVRFLEFMPLCGSSWQSGLFMPIADVRKFVKNHVDLVEEAHVLGQVAQVFKIEGGQGKIGFIGSLTESFCNGCSRIRLTCDGKIRPCLFSHEEVSVRALLRRGASDDEIREAIQFAVSLKPKGNFFFEKSFQEGEECTWMKGTMPYIRSIGG